MKQIALPKLPVYYFERTGRGERLLYCIPAGHLRRLVESGAAKRAILRDYPDGVDIEVSRQSFQLFATDYDFHHPFDASAIWDGFEIMLRRAHKSDDFRGCLYVKSSVLEKFTAAFDRALKELKISRLSEIDLEQNLVATQDRFAESLLSRSNTQRVRQPYSKQGPPKAKRQPSWRDLWAQSRLTERVKEQVARRLSDQPLSKTHPQLPLDQQPWTRVEVTDGVSPLALFIQVQKGSGHASRS